MESTHPRRHFLCHAAYSCQNCSKISLLLNTFPEIRSTKGVDYVSLICSQAYVSFRFVAQSLYTQEAEKLYLSLCMLWLMSACLRWMPFQPHQHVAIHLELHLYTGQVKFMNGSQLAFAMLFTKPAEVAFAMSVTKSANLALAQHRRSVQAVNNNCSGFLLRVGMSMVH